MLGNGVCIDQTRVCDFTDDCGDNSDETRTRCSSRSMCNFEKGLCAWTQDDSDDFNWSRGKGRTPTSSTGPLRDHTTGMLEACYLKQ